MSIFESWGVWFRFILTLVIFYLMVAFAPALLDSGIERITHIYHLIKDSPKEKPDGLR
jgi:hypothetical protein